MAEKTHTALPEGVARPGRKKTRYKSVARDYAEAVFVALVVAFVLRAFVAQAFKIPSGSMKPTLLVGDYIVIEKISYAFNTPARGDVVVFKYPHQDNEMTAGKWFREKFDLIVYRRHVPRRDYVKRIIGISGDVVYGKGGAVRVNGRVLREPYARGAVEDFGPFKVPPRAYFVMGDNRGDSRDSRHWGFVDRKLIRGRAVFIYWSWIPSYCPKHRSSVTRLYHVRTGASGAGEARPAEYICDAGGERLVDGEDIRQTHGAAFWSHVRGDRIFLLIE